MNERTYTVTLPGKNVRLTSQHLAKFRKGYEWFMANSEISTHMSELIWLDMYILNVEFGVSPLEILKAINELECREASSSGVKPATQFRNPPLKGLWHKHYFSAHFLGKNIALGLGRTGIERLVNEVMDPEKSPVVTQEMIQELAHRVTREPVEARNADKKLTGEWIIFLKRGDQNYYLCCNTHGAGDQFIYDRINEHCVRDFPELPVWLQELQV